MDYDRLSEMESVLEDMVTVGREAARYEELDGLIDLTEARRELIRVRDVLGRYDTTCMDALNREYERAVL